MNPGLRGEREREREREREEEKNLEEVVSVVWPLCSLEGSFKKNPTTPNKTPFVLPGLRVFGTSRWALDAGKKREAERLFRSLLFPCAAGNLE